MNEWNYPEVLFDSLCCHLATESVISLEHGLTCLTLLHYHQILLARKSEVKPAGNGYNTDVKARLRISHVRSAQVKDNQESLNKPSGRLRDRIVTLARIPGIKVEQARARLIKIPFFGFLNEVIEGMGNDGASEVAGAIAYYAILSLFPLLLGVISLLGFFLPSAKVQDQIFSLWKLTCRPQWTY